MHLNKTLSAHRHKYTPACVQMQYCAFTWREAKLYLQESGELGVPVRDVAPGPAINQGTDYIPQSTQGQIDLGRLLEPVTRCTCISNVNDTISMSF